MLRLINQIRSMRLLFTTSVMIKVFSLLTLLIYLLYLLANPVQAQDLEDTEVRLGLLDSAADASQAASAELPHNLQSAVSSRAEAETERAELLEKVKIQEADAVGSGLDLRALMKAPQPLPGGPEWQQALTEGREELANDTARGVGSGPLVFVSFSLGESALKSYLQSAPRYGATLVFRGFKDNDIKAHLGALRALIGEEEGLGGMVVDPTLYHRFGIHHVPSFVLPESAVPACNTNGCGEVAFVKARGAVSIERFLEEVRRRGEKPFPEMATVLIEKGKGNEYQ